MYTKHSEAHPGADMPLAQQRGNRLHALEARETRVGVPLVRSCERAQAEQLRQQRRKHVCLYGAIDRLR